LQLLPRIIALRNSCQTKTRWCFAVRRSWYYTMLFLVLFVCLFLFFLLQLLISPDLFCFQIKLNLLFCWIKVWLHLTLRTHCMSSDLCSGYMSSGLFTDYT